MNIGHIVKRDTPPADWQTWSKIPWNEPAFSARMLENHLSQEHDWASRTQSAIDAQVAFIHAQLPTGARVLDLGCGPGLYTSRLSALGHQCTGVDFSPASIDYARNLPGADSITYILGDITRFQAAEGFDAVLLLFGEINAFSRLDAAAILESAFKALHSGGTLFIETHSFDAIRDIGFLPSTWQAMETGLFSEKPHLCLEEHFWNEALASAMTRYYILDAETGNVTEYSALMQAYSEAQYNELLHSAGFQHMKLANETDWPTGKAFTGKLQCRIGSKL
ncbi:methyltransferase domain-containing protein [Desulfovibrio sp. OttesenSCG-928-I05]|nr:methyltransferase domain-containing protein [Desulfovibrio sp. OttesenSCG-928-I05]